jgi:diguanylate cyclase (GGDEF)-like protein
MLVGVAGALLLAVAAWALWRLRVVADRAGELGEALEARTTELESARLQLLRQCTEDSLTAVANHEQFLDFLEREWRRARRDALPLAVVFVDLDDFRAYNRQYGRRAGDDCLRRVGRALTATVGRGGDLVARYHRDEFALALASTDGPGAAKVAERARAAVEALQIPGASESPGAVLTASVAVAAAVPARESAWEELDLIKAGRFALREARIAGGNQVRRASLGLASRPEILG